jgi:hypothetical protein
VLLVSCYKYHQHRFLVSPNSTAARIASSSGTIKMTIGKLLIGVTPDERGSWCGPSPKLFQNKGIGQSSPVKSPKLETA